ncbi:MAG: hypothetical protein ACERKZ_08725 [Lachnotalea sp.]
MQELLTNIKISYEAYISVGKVLLLLTAICGLIMVKTNQRMRIVIIYVIVGSLVIVNPFFVNKAIQLLGETNLYRMGMILMIPILSSYAITVLYKQLKDKKQKMIAMTGIVILIAASGKFVYTPDPFYQLNNNGKVYDLAVELSDCVTQSYDSPTVAISELQGVFIRQYNAHIKLIGAPEVTENWQEASDDNALAMSAILKEPLPDMLEVTKLAKTLGCNYLILMEDQIKQDSPANYGLNYIDTFDGFVVFENNLGAE